MEIYKNVGNLFHLKIQTIQYTLPVECLVDEVFVINIGISAICVDILDVCVNIFVVCVDSFEFPVNIPPVCSDILDVNVVTTEMKTMVLGCMVIVSFFFYHDTR